MQMFARENSSVSTALQPSLKLHLSTLFAITQLGKKGVMSVNSSYPMSTPRTILQFW